MNAPTPKIIAGGRYWVLGGKWVDGQRHLPWPRVYGPFDDYEAARSNAQELNRPGDPAVRYMVVADLEIPGERQ